MNWLMAHWGGHSAECIDGECTGLCLLISEDLYKLQATINTTNCFYSVH